MLKFNCLACGKRLKAPRTLAGRVAQCSKCLNRVTVPVPGPLRTTVPSQPDAPLHASSFEYDDAAFDAILERVKRTGHR